MKLLASVLFLFGLALPAQATTYYASTSGSGSACSQASPCSLNTLISTVQAGDIGMVNPGTYGGSFTISGKSGTQANPITLRAVNPAVNCPDPDNDPDGCEINLSNRSIITGAINVTGGNADWWVFEGFQVQQIICTGQSLANSVDNGVWRFGHQVAPVGNPDIVGNLTYCQNWRIEHSYWTKLNASTGGYGWRLQGGGNNATFYNVYCGGAFNHCISLKRAAHNISIDRWVCDGHQVCLDIGQEEDDNFSQGATVSCPNTLKDDGSTGTIWDTTINGGTIRNVFARLTNNSGATASKARYGIKIDNARDITVENVFSAPGGQDSATGLYITNVGTSAMVGGRCGIERGNISIRGMVVVASNTETGCARIHSLGESPGTVTIENFVCHGADDVGDPGVIFGSHQLGHTPAWETTAGPTTTIRNSIFNDCTTAWTGQGGTLSFTQSHNDFFNCGASPGGIGTQTVDPQFVGPESAPQPNLDSGHFIQGKKLWDWGGTYLPIVNRFKTQNTSLEGAGTGSAAPCEGTCDIGVNQFFVPFDGGGGPAPWASCAVYGNGDQVFEPYTAPWIDGRTGLVIDVDCERRQFVIGRCDDPLDEDTCDTDVYIHKVAQLRKQRTNEPITLSAGTTGSAQDTSGTCWRTRATFDFTESLETLTGIWVRYEVDPDGGAHTCSSLPETVEWAWQGAE